MGVMRLSALFVEVAVTRIDDLNESLLVRLAAVSEYLPEALRVTLLGAIATRVVVDNMNCDVDSQGLDASSQSVYDVGSRLVCSESDSDAEPAHGIKKDSTEEDVEVLSLQVLASFSVKNTFVEVED